MAKQKLGRALMIDVLVLLLMDALAPYMAVSKAFMRGGVTFVCDF